VQSQQDAARLSAGGLPWPTGLQRANLGVGFYAWDSPEAAEHYRNRLQRHGATHLRIVVYEMADEHISNLKVLDLTRMRDEDVNAWMERYSEYGQALPHDWQYVIRHTDLGPEHYLAASVFSELLEVS
jgi:hypothetical protein